MIIGIIGGIGCGKTTVLNYLETQYNAEIIVADQVAKEIMSPGSDVFEQIKKAFPEVIGPTGINQEKLAKLVFEKEELLKKLNTITHPGTIDEINRRIDKSKADIIVIESAILIGSGIEERCDEIWFIYCNREKRIDRLMNERGYSREKAESIILNQPTDEEYNLACDEFIDNSCSFEDTKEKIDLILSTLPCGF